MLGVIGAPRAHAGTLVAGSVTDSGTSAPIEGASVSLYRVWTYESGGETLVDDYEYLDGTETVSTGAFSFTLPDDSWTYAVRASSDGHESRWTGGVTSPYDDGFTFFTAATLAAGVIPAISLPTAIEVSGTLADAGGVPISDGEVDLYRVWTSEDAGTTVVDDYEDLDYVNTDADGHYSFTLPDSSWTYSIRAFADGYASRWLGGTSSIYDSAAQIFTAAEPASHILPDLKLPLANKIEGVVSDNNGAVGDIAVDLYRWQADDAFWDSFDEDYTDGDGKYSFSGMPDGTYTLMFDQTSALGGGSSLPDTPTALNSVTVAGGQIQTVNFVLPPTYSVSGTISGPDGPLQGASVQPYQWNGAAWTHVNRNTTSDADGTYTVGHLAPGTYTLRVVKSHFSVGFLGGDSAFPETPAAGNSFAIAAANVTGKNVTLTPRAPTLGKVAGQNLAYCKTNELAPNDDGSSAAVQVPFDLKYFGNTFTQLYVNNNGNVTFDGPKSQYTPNALNGGTSVPIIAPFFADVDTRDTSESDVVTYGASPDGNQFCVNWADVEPYVGTSHEGLLNTFQLILTKRSDVAGRSPGDFDITFNYDQIQWDTGDVSNGISAVAGYASGTGADGTFFQLEGSLVNGAFLDGGGDALVSGEQNSGHAGRYLYEVRNSGLAGTLGGVSGKVLLPNDDPAANSYVEVSNDSRAYYTRTNSNGEYSVSGVNAGTYDIRAWPNDDTLRQAGTTATVTAGETTVAPDIQFEARQTMPAGVGVSSSTFGDAATGTVPTIYYHDDFQLSYSGSPGGAASYVIKDPSGNTLRSGAMTESSAGNYSATVASLYPNHGDATITITFTPAGGSAEAIGFDIYIDPSGTVVDNWGFPVVGASVTLLRSDTVDGTYAAVPDGSSIMSPSNRSNPMLSGSGGEFGWDVTAAWYKLRIEKSGYTTYETAAMQVPPARLSLVLKLDGGSAPSLNSTMTGSATVGSKLTAHRPAGLPSGFDAIGYQWKRDGNSIAGATDQQYTVAAEDQGKNVSVTVRVRRAETAVDPLTPDVHVAFTAFDAGSGSVRIPGGTSSSGKPSFGKVPKSAKYGKPIALKLSCADGCSLGLALKIGSKTVKGLKAIKLNAGTTSYKLKLSSSIQKKIKAALKKNKKTKIKLALSISGAGGSGGSKTVKLTP